MYNVETLVQYILATGDFSEPQTRIPFSEENLRQIDYEVGSAFHFTLRSFPSPFSLVS